MPISRRAFLQSAAASLTLPSLAGAQTPASAEAAAGKGGSQLFRHGVASGDPLADRILLWTRVTDPSARNSLEVEWRVATDEPLTRIVARGTAASMAARDFTVKVDVAGLEPGRTYYYAFIAGGQRSTVGRTRTLAPRGTGRARFAVASCANYGTGYYNAYRAIANRDDLDAVLHLGDYIYETASGSLGRGPEAGRVAERLEPAVTLDDYRLRYAAYRSDEDLQLAHARHPFVAVWDDHEIADNAWADSDRPRMAAAYRAYLEWMPIRESTQTGIRLYRSFRVGDLADIVILDTRGLRDRQLAPEEVARRDSDRRSLLGRPQEDWLFDRLRGSQQDNTRWRIVGQQIVFSSLNPGGPPPNPDMWEGYPAARRRVTSFLQQARIDNVAILSGDLHSSWAFDVRPVAVEIVAPAISSTPLYAYPELRDRFAALRPRLEQLHFMDGEKNGYVLLDLTRERLQAEWYFVSDVTSRSDAESRGAAFVCERGAARLSPA